MQFKVNTIQKGHKKSAVVFPEIAFTINAEEHSFELIEALASESEQL